MLAPTKCDLGRRLLECTANVAYIRVYVVGILKALQLLDMQDAKDWQDA